MPAEFFYRDPRAPRPNKPNHIGVSIIVEYDHRILMEHRTDSETWAMIGGGLEIDETLAHGALRELWEETGIRLTEEDLKLYRIYDDPSRIASFPDGNILRMITVVYHTVLKELPRLVCSEESRELAFLTLDQIRELPVAATHKHILEDIASELPADPF